MDRSGVFGAGFLMLLTAFLSACSRQPETSPRDAADANDTGRVLSAQSETERSLLTQLSTLPTGTARRVGDATVLSEAPYDAASGRTCRALQITTPGAREPRHRLACSDGKAWFFVPDVFGRNPTE
jgi:hypothetical protein